MTGRDITRLSIFLGLSVPEVMRALDFYILSPGETIPDGLKQIPSVITERGPAYVALRKMENHECVFLEEDLCMIHPIRPSVCVSFPFVFSGETKDISWGLNAMNEICPGLGTGPEVNASELESTAVAVLDDLRVFREFSEEWNKNDKSPSAKSFVEAAISDPRFDF